MLTPCFFASLITISPAVTRVSLLARAIFLPFLIAKRVGTSPAIPTTDVTTVSISFNAETSHKPSSPPATRTGVSDKATFNNAAFFSSATATTFGLYFLACCSNNCILELPLKPKTSRSLLLSTTFKVWVPIEPVLPKTDIFIKSPK